MPAIHLHLSWFADHHEIRPHLWIGFHECIRRDTIAPFFHVPEVVGSVTIEKTEVSCDRQSVDHAGRGSFLVTRATCVQVSVLHFTHEWIPFPFTGISYAYRI